MNRKRLLNYHEEVTDKILQQVAEQNNARTFAKVRIADVLEINNSGLSNEHYSYALKAHFDFVVADDNSSPLFAVEFDGPHHLSDKKASANDQIKNYICQQSSFPLLRIDINFITREIRSFTLLGWLTDLWFMNEAFNKAQERGEIAPEEPFLYFSILSTSMKNPITMPYDLSLPARIFFKKCNEQNLCKDFTPLIHISYDNKKVRCLSLFRIDGDRIIISNTSCYSFKFPPVAPWELCEELAMIDTSELLRSHLEGERQIRVYSRSHVDLVVKQFKEAAQQNKSTVWQSGVIWND